MLITGAVLLAAGGSVTVQGLIDVSGGSGGFGGPGLGQAYTSANDASRAYNNNAAVGNKAGGGGGGKRL